MTFRCALFLRLSLCGVLLWPNADSFFIVVGMGISDNTLQPLVKLMTQFSGMLFGLVGEINVRVRISTRDYP